MGINFPGGNFLGGNFPRTNNSQLRTNLQSLSGVWDHQSEYVFTEETRTPSFSSTSQIFRFYQEICFKFFYQWGI